MRASELRKALEGVPDDAEVVVDGVDGYGMQAYDTVDIVCVAVTDRERGRIATDLGAACAANCVVLR
jgi:hypothetical protein